MFEAYWIYYLLGVILLPGIILGVSAQIKVQSTFNEYKKVQTMHGKSAKEVARYMLDGGGCVDTKIVNIKGELTDNYNPKTNTVSLSDSVYNDTSVAAIGVTAHEIGHAFQHREKYAPVRIRSALVPIMNIAGAISWPLIIIGLVLEIMSFTTGAPWLIYIGMSVYALDVIFCLVTLPVEINASKRAYKMLVSTGEMDPQEAEGVKKVLNAAAWTYVAALITSILSLLRVILFVFRMRRDR